MVALVIANHNGSLGGDGPEEYSTVTLILGCTWTLTLLGQQMLLLVSALIMHSQLGGLSPSPMRQLKDNGHPDTDMSTCFCVWPAAHQGCTCTSETLRALPSCSGSYRKTQSCIGLERSSDMLISSCPDTTETQPRPPASAGLASLSSISSAEWRATWV